METTLEAALKDALSALKIPLSERVLGADLDALHASWPEGNYLTDPEKGAMDSSLFFMRTTNKRYNGGYLGYHADTDGDFESVEAAISEGQVTSEVISIQHKRRRYSVDIIVDNGRHVEILVHDHTRKKVEPLAICRLKQLEGPYKSSYDICEAVVYFISNAKVSRFA